MCTRLAATPGNMAGLARRGWHRRRWAISSFPARCASIGVRRSDAGRPRNAGRFSTARRRYSKPLAMTMRASAGARRSRSLSARGRVLVAVESGGGLAIKIFAPIMGLIVGARRQLMAEMPRGKPGSSRCGSGPRCPPGRWPRASRRSSLPSGRSRRRRGPAGPGR